MVLKIFLPREALDEREVDYFRASAPDGSFAIEPRHIDFTTILVPGILEYRDGKGSHYMATDRGVLVKRENELLVSVRRVVEGKDLKSLARTVEEEFLELDDREKRMRTAITKLESNLSRNLMELNGP